MIHDPHLHSFLQELTVSLDPIEQFRLTIGEPDPWQEELLRTDPAANEADRMVMALCGRQSGKSTTCGCLAYDDFSVGKTVILTAPSLRQSTELFRRILEFKYSDPFCPPIVRQMQTELEAHPRHGGRIIVVPATDQARGMTADTILADEACFLDDDALTAFFPMRRSSGRLFLLSTPNLRTGYFYDTWTSAKRVRRIMARSIDIERRRAQVEFDRATMSETTFRREHLCEFVGSGTPLLSWDTLERTSTSGVKALELS
ncbi:terminase large subunit domain-containing protein [Ruegeria arenilitoris]|uniref:terminase large subunit domain-containing protein n=1 Tax=Ruegeria arenilitoris TaxID=1173585 RepID=UPI00147A0629|nr:terminase family protein [Ruegeria arenilitoris]